MAVQLSYMFRFLASFPVYRASSAPLATSPITFPTGLGHTISPLNSINHSLGSINHSSLQQHHHSPVSPLSSINSMTSSINPTFNHINYHLSLSESHATTAASKASSLYESLYANAS